MAKLNKILQAVLSGRQDQNVRFTDLCKLVLALGFEERIRGGHHIYTRDGVAEIINLQPRRDGQAKPYQVKQVRAIITSYKLGLDES